MRTRHEERGERQWPSHGRDDDRFEPDEGFRSREWDEESERERRAGSTSDRGGDWRGGGPHDRGGDWRGAMGGSDWRGGRSDRGGSTGSRTDWRTRGTSDDRWRDDRPERGWTSGDTDRSMRDERAGGPPYGGPRDDRFGGPSSGQPFGGPTERGRFSGIGPNGYQRSEERIREDVCDRLTMDGDIDASDISVQVSQGEVTLTGTVDSRRTKRRAEDVIEDVPGVREVHNQLRVDNPASLWQTGGFSSAQGGTMGRLGQSHMGERESRGPESRAGSRERERERTGGGMPMGNGREHDAPRSGHGSRKSAERKH